MNSEKVQEGNKTYYKLAGMLFSEAAYKNLHQLNDKKGLRINLKKGGCSGFKYHYDFCDGPQGEDKTLNLSDDLEIYIDDFTIENSSGTVLDFSLGLHGSGLKIINPNQKGSCSCGVSFGLTYEKSL